MHFDFAPLYRTTIGFERLAQLLDSAAGFDTDSGYPPYNIERLAENAYRITMAVAGFSRDEITIEAKEGLLTVRGEKKPEDKERLDGEFVVKLKKLEESSPPKRRWKAAPISSPNMSSIRC